MSDLPLPRGHVLARFANALKSRHQFVAVGHDELRRGWPADEARTKTSLERFREELDGATASWRLARYDKARDEYIFEHIEAAKMLAPKCTEGLSP